MLWASLVCVGGVVVSALVLLRSNSRASSNETAVREAVAAQAAERLKKVQEVDDAAVTRLAESDDPIDDVIRDHQPERAKLASPGMELEGPRWNWTAEDLTRWQQDEVARSRKSTANRENFKTMALIIVILAVSGVVALFLYQGAASQPSPAPATAPAEKVPAVAPKRP